MNFKKHMLNKAKELKRSIALPEATDERVLRAAHRLIEECIAKDVYLVGNKADILKKAEETKIDISKCILIDPNEDAKKEDYIQTFYDLRKAKGISEDDAKKAMLDPLNYAAMMCRKGDSYAILAGATHSTADVLRAGLTIIKTSPGVKTASSYFIMDTYNPNFGHEGLILFSDCGMLPDPNAEQLADIAISSAQSFEKLIGVTPKIAMLSFSTKGSATSPSTQKVVEATQIVKERNPNLIIDGELQLDSAVIPEVAEQKAKGSPIAGKANILVFPNLDAGNIGYKLVQRFARAEAYGPLLQGFAYPISDLSRGCNTEEIIMTAAIVLTQERS